MESIDKTRLLALEYDFRIRLPRRIFEQAFQSALKIEEVNERANELIKQLRPRFTLYENRLDYREFCAEISFQDDWKEILSLIEKTFETIQEVEVPAERDYLTRLFVSAIDRFANANNPDLNSEKIQYYIDLIQDSEERQLALEHWGESVASYNPKCDPFDLKTLVFSIVDQIEDQDSCEKILVIFLESLYSYFFIENKLRIQNKNSNEPLVNDSVCSDLVSEKPLLPIILDLFEELITQIETPVYRMFSFFRLSCCLRNDYQLSEKGQFYFDQCLNILNDISDSLETDRAISEIFDSIFLFFSNSDQDFSWETQICFSLLKHIQNKQLAAKCLESFFSFINDDVVENKLSKETTEELFALITDLENFATKDNSTEIEAKIETLNSLASIYYRLKRSKTAKNLVRTILSLLNQVENESERSSFYLSLYYLHRKVGQNSASQKLLDLLEQSTDRIVPDDFRKLQWKTIIGGLCSEWNRDFAAASRFLPKIAESPEFWVFQTKLDWTQFDQYLTHLFQQLPDDSYQNYFDFPVYSEDWIEQNVQNVFQQVGLLENQLDQAKTFRLMLDHWFAIRNDIDLNNELNSNIIPFE
ncbi:MAG: hypothetical protein Q4C95_04950 [Planctomycetia bacterium]|nr:hypothetical protein [Planctomycetia bacterium]